MAKKDSCWCSTVTPRAAGETNKGITSGETGHRMDRHLFKSPRAFLPPFLLWNMGPDGEEILLGTSHSHSSALMNAEFHLTLEEQKLLPGITVSPPSSCKSWPGQHCSSLLRLCGPFPSPLCSWLLLAFLLPFGHPGIAKLLPSRHQGNS